MAKKRYSSNYLTTSYKDIVFSEKHTELVWMWITNRGGSAATLEIAHVPAGATAGETMDLIHDHSLDSNAYITNEILICLEPGDRIAAKSNTSNSIVVTFYGREYEDIRLNTGANDIPERPINRSVRGSRGKPRSIYGGE